MGGVGMEAYTETQKYRNNSLMARGGGTPQRDQFPTSTQAQLGREACGGGVDSNRQAELDTWAGYTPLPWGAGDAQGMTHTKVRKHTEACTDREDTPI